MRVHSHPEPGVAQYQRRPGAYAVLQDGGDVLLTHQESPVPEFQLPGGGIDPGEHPVEALRREVREETGWSIAAPRRLGAFRAFTFMPDYDLWAEKICVIYLARPVRAVGDPIEPGHRAVWMSLAMAANTVASPGDRAFLRALQRARSCRTSPVPPVRRLRRS